MADQEVQNLLKQRQEQKKRIAALKNQVTAVRIERLKLLKQHYQDYWLDLDLKSHDSKLDSLTSRARYTVYATSKKRVEDIMVKFNEETSRLDTEILEAQDRLERFRRLDPKLLSEYRKLKDDIECQELLIKISGENNAKDVN